MIKTEDIAYADGDVSCLGYLAYDDSRAEKRPGVLVVHEAWGLGEHAMQRAGMLAEAGFVALAADLYGNRRQAAGIDEVRDVMGNLWSSPEVLRARAKAGLSALAAQPLVDSTRLFAIGFCFGGTTVLELARGGSDLLGVVSFHGSLETSAPATKGTVKAGILVCTGADDPVVPLDQRTAFEEEMRSAGCDWQLIAYGNTQHSFTNPFADSSIMPGIAYDELADRRSWQHMLDFFDERLK